MKVFAAVLIFVSLLAAQQKRVFWAFRTPVKADPPLAYANPIDAFLLAKLNSKGLTFSPRATERDLIRRLHFGLTGLPPRDADYGRTYSETVEKQIGRASCRERV